MSHQLQPQQQLVVYYVSGLSTAAAAAAAATKEIAAAAAAAAIAYSCRWHGVYGGACASATGVCHKPHRRQPWALEGSSACLMVGHGTTSMEVHSRPFMEVLGMPFLVALASLAKMAQ